MGLNSKTNGKPVIIIGAGPAGLSCAVRLIEQGCSVLVLEASPYVGGLSRSISLWGKKVDLGPHRFFTKHPSVQKFWEGFLNNEFERVRRLTRIYYRGKFFQYPIEPLDVFKNLNLKDLIHSIFSYFYQALFVRTKITSFEDFVTNRFGKKLYEIFFRTYTEKVWGIPCARIDAEWALQRIGTFSLSQALKNALHIRINAPRTLLREFFYPKGGAGIVYERMAQEIRRKGGAIQLNSPVKNILRDNEGSIEGVELFTGEKLFCSHLVSTMPITNLISGLTAVPDRVRVAKENLSFRSSVLVYLKVDSSKIFFDQWVYVHSPELKLGRITNFNNWSGAQKSSIDEDSSSHGQSFSILCLEYWCFENSDFWKRNEKDLAALATLEIRSLKLFPEDINISDFHVLKIPKSYPVYELGYKSSLNEIHEFLGEISNLHVIGRYGSFQYNNQDHSILMGLNTADEIIGKRKNETWNLSTETTYFEEIEQKI